jgi:hypothetical protein
MAQALINTYTATTTGVQGSFGAPGGAPFSTYALQVKGTGAAPTSWSVTLEGSLDNANWTTIITHSATDGSTQFDTNGKPVLFVRVNVGSLSLGSATNIVIKAVAVP